MPRLIVDLQHTAVPLPDARGRGMKDRGRIGPYVAHSRQARLCPASRHRGGNVALRNKTEPMRTRRDQQRRVVRRHVVEMNPQRHHPFDHRERRLNVKGALLDGPRAKAARLPSFAHYNRAILMPAERPISLGRLVERDRPDRPGTPAEIAGSDRSDRAVVSQMSESWLTVQTSAPATLRQIVGKRVQVGKQGQCRAGM